MEGTKLAGVDFCVPSFLPLLDLSKLLLLLCIVKLFLNLIVSFVERVSLLIVNKCFFKVCLLLLILLLCLALLEDKFVDVVVVHLKCFKVSYFE